MATPIQMARNFSAVPQFDFWNPELQNDDDAPQQQPVPTRWLYDQTNDAFQCGVVTVNKDGLFVNGQGTLAVPLADIVTRKVVGGNAIFQDRKARFAKSHRDPNTYVIRTYARQETGQVKKVGGLDYYVQQLLFPVIHHNVVKTMNIYCESRCIRVLMEYMNGGTLERLIAEKGPLPAQINALIASQIVCGLEALHAAGYIHRDLQPANIHFNSNGSVKIGGFGMAKHLDADATSASTTSLGTVFFWSPERARRERHTQASDIWCVGLLVAYMCSANCMPLMSPVDIEAALDPITGFLIPDEDGGYAIRTNQFELETRLIENEASFNRRLQSWAANLIRPGEHPIQCPAEMEDFIHKSLAPDRTRRPTIAGLLGHPFIRSVQQNMTEEELRNHATIMVKNWLLQTGFLRTH